MTGTSYALVGARGGSGCRSPGAFTVRPARRIPLRAELLAWQSVLREDVVLTGLTAAQVRGWWLPPLPSTLPVFACAGLDRNAPRRPGLVVTRHVLPPLAESVRGLRVT